MIESIRLMNFFLHHDAKMLRGDKRSLKKFVLKPNVFGDEENRILKTLHKIFKQLCFLCHS